VEKPDLRGARSKLTTDCLVQHGVIMTKVLDALQPTVRGLH